nr:MAG TPA: hypothetical protein [Caudoviricetes sp.]
MIRTPFLYLFYRLHLHIFKYICYNQCVEKSIGKVSSII